MQNWPDGAGDSDGGTGLYCGEQDMFCFLIDPACATEIEGEAFAGIDTGH